MNAQPTTTPTTPQPKRMAIDKITRGKKQEPFRILLFGPEGIGKSTFGAAAPNPVFIGAEDGTAQLDVSRFPKPESWSDILEAVRTLTTDQHEFQTVVVDTLDAVEPLVWGHMIRRDTTAKSPLRDIEDYGFGKGYSKALDEWRVLVVALERLRATRGMNIILLAHSWVKSFKNPEGDDFDRYELKLNAKAGGLLKEWCDAVLFATYETYAHKDERTKRVRGVSTGARLIYTQRTAAYDAKNRYGLPETLPLSWSDFETSAQEGKVHPVAELKVEILRKAKELNIEDKVQEPLSKAGDDSRALAIINNRLNARLAERAQEAQ